MASSKQKARVETPPVTDVSPAIVVRPARPSDLADVVAIDAADTGTAKPDYWKSRYEWYVGRHADGFFLVAEREGRMLGYVVGEIRAWEFGTPPSGWIFAIGVSPGDRLHGLGTTLVEALCERFRKAGVTQVRTMLAKDAHLLMSFFRSLGMMAGPFVQLEKRLEP
jgi:ribosomal protein S18 acetylase RimI-like enzyme